MRTAQYVASGRFRLQEFIPGPAIAEPLPVHHSQLDTSSPERPER